MSLIVPISLFPQIIETKSVSASIVSLGILDQYFHICLRAIGTVWIPDNFSKRKVLAIAGCSIGLISSFLFDKFFTDLCIPLRQDYRFQFPRR